MSSLKVHKGDHTLEVNLKPGDALSEFFDDVVKEVVFSLNTSYPPYGDRPKLNLRLQVTLEVESEEGIEPEVAKLSEVPVSDYTGARGRIEPVIRELAENLRHKATQRGQGVKGQPRVRLAAHVTVEH